MKNYELLYILPASETSEEIVKNFHEVEKNIEKFGGKMLTTLLEHPFLTKTGMSKDEESDEIKALPLVKRKLAYPIKHEKFGFYCLVNFEVEGEKIIEIDEYLRLHSVVLRHIITEANPMTQEELDILQTLFARKKAEQDREEAEKENGKAKAEEAKRANRKEEAEAAPKAAAEKTAEVKAEEAATVVEEAPEEVKTETKAEKEKEVKVEEPAQEEKAEETKVEKAEAKEDKKASKKSKIKLEELEDKLDEILEDTIV